MLSDLLTTIYINLNNQLLTNETKYFFSDQEIKLKETPSEATMIKCSDQIT